LHRIPTTIREQTSKCRVAVNLSTHLSCY